MIKQKGVTILHVVTSSLSAKLMRGQLSHLRTKGFDVYLASSPGQDLSSICQEEHVGEISLDIAREISLLRDTVALVKLWLLLRRLRPTITNVSTPKAGLLAGIAALAARVPVRVYTLRGLRVETATGANRWLLAIMERIACGSAQYVRCVSFSVRDRAIELNLVKATKAYVVGRGSSNGVDYDRFQNTPERKMQAAELRRLFNIPGWAPVIGFVGRFTRDKGITELYEAFVAVKNMFPDVRLLLLGGFEEGDPVDAAVRRGLEREPNVIFAGMVKDTPPYYAAMDVLALPTYREGFPNVPLEAQAAGVPVVTTRVTGAVDSVIDRVTGRLVAAHDADALAQALIELLAWPEKRKHMGIRASSWVRERFRRETVWDELAMDYERMLENREPVKGAEKEGRTLPRTPPSQAGREERKKDHAARRI